MKGPFTLFAEYSSEVMHFQDIEMMDEYFLSSFLLP